MNSSAQSLAQLDYTKSESPGRLSHKGSKKKGLVFLMASKLVASPLWRSLKIFDAHSHIGDFPELNIFDRRVDEIIAYNDKYNISYSAISSITGDTSKDNRIVADAIKKYPDRFVGLAHIDPNLKKTALNEFEKCVSKGFRGVKLHPKWDNYVILDENLIDPLLEKISDERLPVMIHTGNYPMSVPIQVAVLAKKYPKIKFICAHMGIDASAEAIAAAKFAPNVLLETAGTSSAGEVEMVVRRVGADRILFGTDPPYGKFVAEFFKIISLEIPDGDKNRILWSNAARLYEVKS
jgi:predicted TIM-barrel fold metal-dependent hydrolase